MRIDGIEQKIFAELGKERKLQLQHDIIYKLTGLVIDYVNASGEALRLSPLEHFSPCCRTIRSYQSGMEACLACARSSLRSAMLQRNVLVYQCHAGLYEVILPLFDSRNEYIGAMTSGQLLLDNEPRFSQKQVFDFALLHHCNPQEMWKLYSKISVISKRQLDGLIDFLREVGDFITESRSKLLFMESINASDRISLVKRYVEKNYMKEIAIPAVSRKFYLSPNHFCRFFREQTGVSFIEYLNLFRISKAEELLRSSPLNIIEIAFNTGFGSISQFNRVFRNVKGMTPRQFRQSNT